MRKYTITVYRPDYVEVTRAAYGETRNPLLGYGGENESTELTIGLPEWTGSFYLDWHYSGEWHEGEAAHMDNEIVYAVPGEILIPGDVYLRIRAEDGDSVIYTDPIKFVVRR